MGFHELVLDRDVRDWVFIPLTLFIVLMKLMTQYVHQMTSVVQPSNKDMAEIREQQATIRSQRIRTFLNFMPESSFRMRKLFFGDKEEGVFSKKPRTKPMHETMATDPTFMVDMMKKNLTGIVPQIVMGTAVSFFFSGFVMGKIPFGLSPRFRPMLQRGVDLLSLDVSYFTSLSYYIALLFASRGIFSLVFMESTVDETEMMRRQMNPMGQAAGFDAKSAFQAENTAYEATEHEWGFDAVEEMALKTLQEAVAQS